MSSRFRCPKLSPLGHRGFRCFTAQFGDLVQVTRALPLGVSSSIPQRDQLGVRLPQLIPSHPHFRICRLLGSVRSRAMVREVRRARRQKAGDFGAGGGRVVRRKNKRCMSFLRLEVCWLEIDNWVCPVMSSGAFLGGRMAPERKQIPLWWRVPIKTTI